MGGDCPPYQNPREDGPFPLVAAVAAAVHKKNTLALRQVKARGPISGSKSWDG